MQAGLPNERQEALKVVHGYLDHPEIAAVLLANDNLDAAKLNRTLQVTQEAASEADLLALAEGCLLAPAAAGPSSSRQRIAALAAASGIGALPSRPCIQGLCAAFKKIQDDPTYWELVDEGGISRGGQQQLQQPFHQRDFVYLLRYLRREMDRAVAAGALVHPELPFSAKQLLAGLRRNFGGLSEVAFVRVANAFIEACGFLSHERPASCSRDTLTTLRESLADAVGPAEDPSTSPFRHVLLLDPTDAEVSVDLLFELRLLNPAATTLVALADFAEDAHELRRSEAVASIKAAAEAGHTVLLTHAAPIASSLYDLLNRHHKRVATAQGRWKYYSNIAIGRFELVGQPLLLAPRYSLAIAFLHDPICSFSRPCAVHPRFRIVVHLPFSAVSRTPQPFLNRFEKYPLSVQSALAERIASLKPLPSLGAIALGHTDSESPVCNDPALWAALLAGVEHFAAAVDPTVSAPGFVPGETAAAVVLQVRVSANAKGAISIALCYFFVHSGSGRFAGKRRWCRGRASACAPLG